MVEVSLDNTLGAAYLGVCGAAMLFGVTNLQTYVYYLRYPNDWLLHKISVALLYLLDAFHLSLTISVVYHYLITEFGNLKMQMDVVWQFKLQIAINVIIIVYVQTLYAIRVWKLGRHFHRLLPYTIILILLAGYAVGIILAIKTYTVATFAQLASPSIAWSIYLSFSTSTTIDFVIAGAMCWYLQSSRMKMEKFSRQGGSLVGPGVGGNVGGGPTPGRIIGKMMQYVLASGLATSACSMAALITYALMPNTLVFLGIEFLLTKLYINSFLAMLNARRSTGQQPQFSSSGNAVNGGMSTDQFRDYASRVGPLSPGGQHPSSPTSPTAAASVSVGTLSTFRVHVRTSTRTHVSGVEGGKSDGAVGDVSDVSWADEEDDSKSSDFVYDRDKDGSIPMSPLSLKTLPPSYGPHH